MRRASPFRPRLHKSADRERLQSRPVRATGRPCSIKRPCTARCCESDHAGDVLGGFRGIRFLLHCGDRLRQRRPRGQERFLRLRSVHRRSSAGRIRGVFGYGRASARGAPLRERVWKRVDREDEAFRGTRAAVAQRVRHHGGHAGGYRRSGVTLVLRSLHLRLFVCRQCEVRRRDKFHLRPGLFLRARRQGEIVRS